MAMNEEEQQPTLPPALPTQPQKRIVALSVRGDTVWRISLPVLNWMIENGNQELSDKALRTRAYWEAEQDWFIAWGNQTRYFEQAELACRDLHGFKQAMKTLPADNPGMQRIRELALMTGEEFNRPQGIIRKNIFDWKKKRHGRGKHR